MEDKKEETFTPEDFIKGYKELSIKTKFQLGVEPYFETDMMGNFTLKIKFVIQPYVERTETPLNKRN